MPKARIELREHNLWIASHQFWVLYIDGRLVSELNGMATDPNTFNPKPVGGAGDLLKVWEYNSAGFDLHLTPYATQGQGLYDNQQSNKTMLEGDYETVVRPKWEAALAAATCLNQKNIKYHMLASHTGGNLLAAFTNVLAQNSDSNLTVGNSNSIARTLSEVMGFAPVNLSGRLVTGQEKNLLPRDLYAQFYNVAIQTIHLTEKETDRKTI